MKKSYTSSLVLVALFATLSFYLFHSTSSPDLMATWLAGIFYANGAMDQVYPHDTAVYTMLPPPDWWPYLQAQGYSDGVFPFIYPPIWAAAAAALTKVTSFETISAVAGLLNPLMIGGMVVLAAKMTDTRMSPSGYTLVGIGLVLGTTIGVVALEQNQPQILVSFLIVLAAERARANAPVTAGAALALAAAIKLYPVLFVLMWMAAGRWRAVAAFAIVGGALGFGSILIAGWPLHEVFLAQLRIITGTVMVTPFTFSLDPSIGQLFFADKFQFVAALTNAPDVTTKLGWTVMAKTPVWKLLSTGAIPIMAVLLAVYVRRHRPVDPLVWPVAIILLALVSPLSWGYHYLPAIAFAPSLIDRFGKRWGAAILGAIFIPLTIPFLEVYEFIPFVDLPLQIAGTVLMAALAVAFVFGIRRGAA